MVVLSVGMTPCHDMQTTADLLQIPLAETGFAEQSHGPGIAEKGIFAAGAVTGPMSIPESIASGGETAFEVMKYLGIQRKK